MEDYRPLCLHAVLDWPLPPVAGAPQNSSCCIVFFFLLRPDQVAIVQPENCTADLHDLHGDLFGPVQPRPECESLLLRLLPERRHVGDTFWKCYLLTVCSAPLSACAGSFLFTLHLPDARPDPRPANLSGCSGGVVSIQVRGVVSDGFFHCKLGIHC